MSWYGPSHRHRRHSCSSPAASVRLLKSKGALVDTLPSSRVGVALPFPKGTVMADVLAPDPPLDIPEAMECLARFTHRDAARAAREDQ